MHDLYYLNDDHTYTPCDLSTWGNQFRNTDRHLAEDIINNYRVSTVWLGVNHNLGEGPPLLFETMVFDKHGNDIYMDRYSTWDEAIAGHKKTIQWVIDGCNDDYE